mgnify:CR=1 FL=1
MVAPVVFLFHSRDKRDISDIEMAVVAVKAEEVALIRLAGPVAQFGLYAQMFEGTAVGSILILSVKGIKPGFQVEAPMAGKTKLDSRVKCTQCSPIREIGFDPDY